MTHCNKNKQLLDDDCRRMLELLLDDEPSQEELDAVTANIPKAIAHKETAVLLLNFHIKHPTLAFSPEYQSTLHGARALYDYSIYRLSSHFTTICPTLISSGIDVVLLKGGAMFSLEPALFRIMDDIDILVREKDFSKSLKLVRQSGYRYRLDIHSADIHTHDSNAGILDIHRFILLTSGKGGRISEAILSRARRTEFFGVDCLVPSNEDLLFIAVTNFSRNLMDRTRASKIMTALIDLKTIVSRGINWDIFVENTRITGSEDEVSFTVSIINSLCPDLFPQRMENLCSARARLRFSNLFAFRREIIDPLHVKRAELRLWKVAVHPKKIPEFLALRPLYLFLKLFKYSPRMASLIMALLHR